MFIYRDKHRGDFRDCITVSISDDHDVSVERVHFFYGRAMVEDALGEYLIATGQATRDRKPAEPDFSIDGKPIEAIRADVRELSDRVTRLERETDHGFGFDPSRIRVETLVG